MRKFLIFYSSDPQIVHPLAGSVGYTDSLELAIGMGIALSETYPGTQWTVQRLKDLLIVWTTPDSEIAIRSIMTVAQSPRVQEATSALGVLLSG